MLTSVYLEVRDLIKYIMPASIIATCVLISANSCALRMLMMIGMCLYEGVKVRSTLNINTSSSLVFIYHLMTPLERGLNEDSCIPSL